MQAHRVFNVSDEVMIDHAIAVLKAYQERKAFFENFDRVTFTKDFAIHLHEKLKELGTVGGDREKVEVQAQGTNQVRSIMKQCGDEIRLLRYFVNRVFPDKPTRNQFGFTKFQKIKESPDGMVLFMEQLVDTVNKYSRELVEGSYPQGKLPELKRLSMVMSKARVMQKRAKQERNLNTHERVDKLNAIWKTLGSISEAAQLIFLDEPEMKKVFVLPRRASSRRKKSVDTENNEA